MADTEEEVETLRNLQKTRRQLEIRLRIQKEQAKIKRIERELQVRDSSEAGSPRSSLLDLLREDEVIQARIYQQAPKEVIEHAYRDSMVEEVEALSKYSLFRKYTPEALDQVQQLGDDIDKEIQTRAPNIFKLLHSLCRCSAATPEGHNSTRIMSIISVICFTKHQRKCNFLPGLMSLLFQSAGVKRHLYYITRAFGFTESYDSAMGSVQGLISKAKHFIKDRVRLEGSFAFVYDNCDLSVGVSEQGNNKKNELIPITSALIVPVVEPPLGGLKQAHFDPLI